MLSWIKRFKEQDAPGSSHRQWAANVQAFHGAIFSYIESLVVLAALQFAAFQTAIWEVWLLFLCAYCAQVILTGVYFRVGVLLLLGRFGLQGRLKHAALWAAGLAGLMFNVWLVGALSDVAEQIIKAGLAGSGSV